MPLSLIYFADCPKFLPLRSILEELQIPFDLICQDDLEEGDGFRSFSSPSIVSRSGDLIFGNRLRGDECGSCTFVDFDKEKIRNLIHHSSVGLKV